MKKLIKENKLLSVSVSILMAALLSWGIWVTSSIYGQEKNTAITKEEGKTITQSVEEIKQDIKEFKKDVKEDLAKMGDKMNKNQEEVLKILIQIEKNKK